MEVRKTVPLSVFAGAYYHVNSWLLIPMSACAPANPHVGKCGQICETATAGVSGPEKMYDMHQLP